VQTTIIKPDKTQEFWFQEGCHILEISNREDDPQVSVAQARVAPGVTTHWHKLHGVAERYLIVQGTGEVEVGSLERQSVGPGDFVSIPPGTRQRIHNSGETDLVFYAICTPRFTPACYQSMDGEACQLPSK
jgi:mannose-6-phosphate isomerase-like protein (cupin superfamily)